MGELNPTDAGSWTATFQSGKVKILLQRRQEPEVCSLEKLQTDLFYSRPSTIFIVLYLVLMALSSLGQT